MRIIRKDKILKRWQVDFDEKFQLLDKNVQKLREKTQNEINVKLWLGGPGKIGNKGLYSIRKLIGKFLENSKFTVVYSEDFLECADIVSKEVEECLALDYVLIICLSTGSSAESIEFSHYEDIKSKLFVFIPARYKNGFVYRALHGKHGLILEESEFSNKKLIRYNSELPLKVLNRAIACRNEKYRKFKMSEI